MNPAALTLRKRTIAFVFVFLLAVTGVYAYTRLGRLEFPDFVIKIAVVTTPYPGASPREVEQEVTDVIEEAIQSMGQLKEIWSTSQENVSVVYAEMRSDFHASQLPQIWDELRRKVGDAQSRLPPGAGPSIVNDDFGDVYGLFYAVTGDGYSLEELKEYAKQLKNELLLCQDVRRVDFWGVQTEAIHVEIRQAKVATLGISPEQIFGVLQSQNLVSPSGKVQIGSDYVRIQPTGDFLSDDAIGDVLVPGVSGQSLVRLRDIADIRREFVDPPRTLMRLDGKPAIAIGISTVEGGNAVTMAKAVGERMRELEPLRPVGMHLHEISNQGATVDKAVNGFVLNLVQSLIIVIVLLMCFMGWRSGLLIGAVLLLTILGTFIYMWLVGITLQKISLGALILALGMLVDNAIVVADGILIGVQRGLSREDAAVKTVRQTQFPLLGATIIAILAFAAIGFAPGNVGEFCQSLFWVMAASLLLSWVFAVTITPLLCVLFLQIPKVASADPYDRPFFHVYRRFLHVVLRLWPVSLVTVALMLVAALWAFQFVDDYFFGKSERPQFYVDYWRSEGTDIRETSKDLQEIERFIMDQEGVTQVATFVGQGTLRFVLTYDAKDPNPAFGQLLVTVDDHQRIDELRRVIQQYLQDYFPESEPQVVRFADGPPVTYTIEARFRGRDSQVLHDLSRRAQEIMRAHGAVDVSDDWRQPVRVMRPVFSESAARRAGITRKAIADALQANFGGLPIGIYREGTDLLPIIVRAPADQRDDYQDIRQVQIWSQALHTTVPLEQVVDRIDNSVWEDPMIRRRQREQTITARCNPRVGLASPLLHQIKGEIEAIPLPPGYSMEWGGEYKASNEGKEPLQKMFPLCLLAMFVLLICQFNALRQPTIIFLCIPLCMIGVAPGLLLTGLAFGFMAILGLLGLSGMLIKNAIILIDQIEIERAAGSEPYKAVLDSAVSRLRPVTMAAGTTVLGMTPLLWDAFYASMGATIAAGLICATALTLLVVPLFYILFYRIRPEARHV